VGKGATVKVKSIDKMEADYLIIFSFR